MSEHRIGGKTLDEMGEIELRAALRERLRVNVGLVAENTDLKRRVDALEHGGDPDAIPSDAD